MRCVWGKLQGTQFCSSPGDHTQVRDEVPRASIHLAETKHAVGHGSTAQTPQSRAQPLCRATTSPAAVLLPISLLKAIKELQHLQPSPSYHSMSQRAGNVLELGCTGLGWERK